MNANFACAVIANVFILALTIAGCEKKGDTPKPQDSPEPSAPVTASEKTSPPPGDASTRPASAQQGTNAPLPAGHPPLDGGAARPPNPHVAPANSLATTTAAPIAGDGSLSLTGLSMTVPKGWVVQPVIGGGAMAPKAVLQIPNSNGAPAGVRITHFPGMKGMDDANIARWLGQARRPDGSPATREDANISVETVGGVRLTKVDTTGSVKPTMRDAPKANQRMIATIVDHPKGPHFVVITGDKELIESQITAIDAFLKSATVVE